MPDLVAAMKDEPENLLAQKFVENLMLVHNNFFRRLAVPLPLNQFGVLMALYSNECLAITDISQTLKISKQQMTAIVGRLSGGGFITKKSHPSDRRRVMLSLTDSGRKLIERQNKTVRTAFANRLSRLSEGEVRSLGQAMDTINDSISKMFAEN